VRIEHAVFKLVDRECDLLGPDPAWLSHRRFAVWSAGRDFVGWGLWSHVADADAEAMKQSWISLAQRIAQPYDFVLDLSALESISSGAFALIREFAGTRKPGLNKMALIVGEETTGGAIQIGLYVLKPPAFEWRSFHDYREAADWLGPKAAILDAVEEKLHQPALVATPLNQLRALLASSPELPIEAAARHLALSTRSFQRMLADCGTSFSDERDRVRVMRAQELLREPDAKLEAVAASIGCADRRSLNRLFRRLTGESPSEFRRRRGLA
jgi:AraC-like DNA-binding protein